MQYGSDGDNLSVVCDVLDLPEAGGEEPGPNDMIEQVWFASLPSILECTVNDWCVWNQDTADQPINYPRHFHTFPIGLVPQMAHDARNSVSGSAGYSADPEASVENAFSL
jgi:hypothetical protein